ncbi:MAG: hypothetical protein HQK53_07395 [Oligoflexia bacterium]|nr:hypothetical protein [Oligoflexia bacterium]
MKMFSSNKINSILLFVALSFQCDLSLAAAASDSKSDDSENLAPVTCHSLIEKSNLLQQVIKRQELSLEHKRNFIAKLEDMFFTHTYIYTTPQTVERVLSEERSEVPHMQFRLSELHFYAGVLKKLVDENHDCQTFPGRNLSDHDARYFRHIELKIDLII